LKEQELVKLPGGLDKSGKGLWAAISGALELDERDQALLLEAARAKDRLDRLDSLIRKAELVLPDGRANPLLAEGRQQQQTFARLIVALRLPEDLSEPERRPQRRGGLRSVYHPRGLSLVREEKAV
jgi:hypothetical protein